MIRLIFIAAIAAIAGATAQEPGKGSLQVRFLAERAPKELGPLVLASEDKNSAPFELPVNHLSEPVDAPARAFSLRRSSGPPAPLADISLPAEGKSYIVLLIPAAPTGYKPLVISSEDPSFKPGDVYFYNHADKTVLGYVGTSTFILEPGKGRTLTPKGAKQRYYDVGFGVREKEGDRALSSTRWPVEDSTRSYVFFFINPSTKRVDFRSVDEYVSPK